jgi:hypothetical protein
MILIKYMEHTLDIGKKSTVRQKRWQGIRFGKTQNLFQFIANLIWVQYTKTRKRPQKFPYLSSFNILFNNLFTFLEIRDENKLLCLFNRQSLLGKITAKSTVPVKAKICHFPLLSFSFCFLFSVFLLITSLFL